MPKCLLFKSGVNIKPRGTVTPCCMYHVDNAANEVTVDDDWESFYAEKSKEMDSGWINECRECKFMEDDGIQSDRQYAENICTGSPYEYWDLELNNTCNLACRMCAPRSSSKFHNIVKEYSTEKWDKHYVKKQSAMWFKGNQIDSILEKITNAKFVKFTGGEPFLIPQVEKIIDHLIETNSAKNIHLQFISNGTQPMTRWIEKFHYFKAVDIDVSIDAVGERYEYIRPFADWNTVKNNLENLAKNHADKCKISLTTLPMLLNYQNINEVAEFAESIGVEHHIAGNLTSPDFLTLKTLTDTQLQKRFVQQMEIQDRIYGTDWKKFVTL